MSSDNEIRPSIRPDKAWLFGTQVTKLIQELPADCIKSCITCVVFNEQREVCTKWNARPPARVIAYGCKDYFSEEEIPF